MYQTIKYRYYLVPELEARSSFISYFLLLTIKAEKLLIPRSLLLYLMQCPEVLNSNHEAIFMVFKNPPHFTMYHLLKSMLNMETVLFLLVIIQIFFIHYFKILVCIRTFLHSLIRDRSFLFCFFMRVFSSPSLTPFLGIVV